MEVNMKNTKNRKPFYGYYGLINIHIIIALCIILGIFVALFWRLIGIIVVCFGLYNLLMYWMSMYFATKHDPYAYDLSKILKLRGDEQVLDVGCGLGKATIGVAKLLKEGKVVGIDIWNKMDIINVSPKLAYRNAEIEGVRNKVEFKTGNALAIPFPDDTFDLVVAASLLVSFWREPKRIQCLKEIFRVLRPSGKLLVMEIPRGLLMLLTCPLMSWKFLPKSYWINLLNKAGL